MRRISGVFGLILLAFVVASGRVAAVTHHTETFAAAGPGLIDVVSIAGRSGTFTRYTVSRAGYVASTTARFTAAITRNGVTMRFGSHRCKPLHARFTRGALSVSVPIAGGGWHAVHFVSVTSQDVAIWKKSLASQSTLAFTRGKGSLRPLVTVGPCGLMASHRFASELP